MGCTPKRYPIYDTGVHGFGLRVSSSGKKSWIFEYRPGEGGRRTPKNRVTIGAADALTPDEARKLADKLHARVMSGEDPQAAKAVRRHAGLDDVRIHDLRHSHASVGAGENLGLHMIGHLLSHKQPSTTQRDAHLAASPVHAASNKIAGKIARAMGEPAPQKRIDSLFPKDKGAA